MRCILVCALLCATAHATPLVTGNGFGFAVYANGGVSKLYAHPYSFVRPDPSNALGEGVETASFVKRLAWNVPGAPKAVDYLDNSHIIVTERAAGREAFFMPFGLARHALIATWQGAAGPALCVEWAHPVKSQRIEHLGATTVTVYRFDRVDETLVAIPLGPTTNATTEGCLGGASGWALVSLDDAKQVAAAVDDVVRWQFHAAPSALVEREHAEIEAWRVKPAVVFASDQERRLWRQSEIVLRMGQSREPNRPGRANHGLIVACLPDGSWTVPWVRDMAVAIHALIRMGHQAEARAGLAAYFAAQPIGKMQKEVGGTPYQISVVRYFGDGSEEPFFTQEGSTNIEYDNWGLVLWVLGEYVETFHDDQLLAEHTYRGTIYDSAKQFVVRPLLANLEPYRGGSIVAADTSIWEERQKDRKHFAFSTLAAIVGLRRFDALADAHKDRDLHAELGRVLPKLDTGFTAAFVRGSIHGTAEPGIKNDIDGAVLSAINLGVVTDPAVIHKTVEQMARLAVASGGFRRVQSTIEDPKIYEYWYERQEFVFVDLSLAEVYLRMKQPEKAAALMRTIVGKAANDHYFMPEMYVSVVNPLFKGAIGEPTGAIPMVGYGAGAVISYLIERQTR
jgi:hypothetical protein